MSYVASWLSIRGILAGRGGLDVGLRRQVEQVGRFCFSRSRKPLKGKGCIYVYVEHTDAPAHE